MDLAHINHIKNILEKLIFGEVVNSDFKSLEIGMSYLKSVDEFLYENLQFRDSDIDVVDVYKKRVGWYGRAEDNEQIAKELNKEVSRIVNLYDKSRKMLHHQLTYSKLIKRLIHNFYLRDDREFDKKSANWHFFEKILANYDHTQEERKYVIEKMNL